MITERRSLLLVRALLLFHLRRSRVFINGFNELTVFVRVNNFPVEVPPGRFFRPLFSSGSCLVNFEVCFVVCPFKCWDKDDGHVTRLAARRRVRHNVTTNDCKAWEGNAGVGVISGTRNKDVPASRAGLLVTWSLTIRVGKDIHLRNVATKLRMFTRKVIQANASLVINTANRRGVVLYAFLRFRQNGHVSFADRRPFRVKVCSVLHDGVRRCPARRRRRARFLRGHVLLGAFVTRECAFWQVKTDFRGGDLEGEEGRLAFTLRYHVFAVEVVGCIRFVLKVGRKSCYSFFL